MKSFKFVILTVLMTIASYSFAGSGSKPKPEDFTSPQSKPCMVLIGKEIYINANHLSSIWIDDVAYKTEDSVLTKFKPGIYIAVGKTTHKLQSNNPAADQRQIVELIQKTCK